MNNYGLIIECIGENNCFILKSLSYLSRSEFMLQFVFCFCSRIYKRSIKA